MAYQPVPCHRRSRVAQKCPFLLSQATPCAVSRAPGEGVGEGPEATNRQQVGLYGECMLIELSKTVCLVFRRPVSIDKRTAKKRHR